MRGFIGARVGRDSGTGLVARKREPGSDPCPVRFVDEYGWTDVDLLRVAFDQGVSAVLAGAMETLDRSRPVLWLSAAPKSDVEVALALGRLGYRIAAALPTGVVLATSASARPPLAPHMLLLEGKSERRFVRMTSTRDLVTPSGEVVALDGRICRAERIGFKGDGGPGEVLSVALGNDDAASTIASLLRKGVEAPLSSLETTDLVSLLQCVAATFRDGAFRISVPPALLAVFRDLVVSLKRHDGDHVIARRDLRLAENLDDIAVKAPLAMADDNTVGLRLDFHAASGELRSIEWPARLDPGQFTADMVTCYLNRGGGGNPVVKAFASSLGARLAYAEDGPQDGVAVVWGVLRNSKTVIDAVQARRGHFYYIDHAYFARGHLRSYRITRNAFEAGPIRDCPTDRLEGLGIDLQPWKSGGRYILVCPPTDYFMQAHDAHSWLDDTLAALKAHTDREIIVRLKPQPGEAVTPLAEAMAGAHALVTHSSNVAVEAVVAGTPVFVSPTSAAAPMGLTNLAQIEEPVRPNRMPWLAHLTYSQFSFEEVKYGTAWRLLREFEARPFI